MKLSSPFLILLLIAIGLSALFFAPNIEKVYAMNVFAAYEQIQFRVRNDNGNETTATWKAAENTNTTGQARNENFRLRIKTQANNHDQGETLARKIQYKAASGASCSDASGFTDITTDGSVNAFKISLSGNFGPDPTDTSEQLTTAGPTGFIAGDLLESTSSTRTISLDNNETEDEWDLQATNNAGEGVAFIFRLIETDGTLYTTYTVCPQVTIAAANEPPVVSAVNVNGGSDITLVENGTTTVAITATITDDNGCDDVFTDGSISATLYRSGAGASCSADANNCYTGITMTDVGGTCTGGADTSGDASGTVEVWYIAEATDASSSNSGDTWQATVKAIDAASASSTATDSTPPELNTLLAVGVTGSINYGTVNPGATSTTQTVTITNTGNFNSTDVSFSGVNLEFGGDTIAVDQQKYSTTTSEAWDSLDYTLDGTPTLRILNIVKGTATGTPSTQDNYWAIQVPNGQAAGTYSGTSTITAQ